MFFWSNAPALTAAEGPDQQDPAVDDEFYDDSTDFLDEETSGQVVLVSDPLESWNRAMFLVNDRLYFWALKPVCQGYNVVLPGAARIGLKNFFVNVGGPGRMVNCLLQTKPEEAHAEWLRFLVNTTFGILGFWDVVAGEPELALNDEDLGQSLAVYGVGDGAYLVWPIIGPSTVRDTIGRIGDAFLRPTFYIEPFLASAGVWTLDQVNETSFRIGDYETLKEAAFEPYEALKNGYIQLRIKKIEE